MRLLIFITGCFFISCGQNSAKKETKSATDTVAAKTDTTVQTVSVKEIEKDSTTGPSPLETWVNGMLSKKEGNKWHVLNDREAKWISGQFEYFIAPKRKQNPDYPYIAKADFNDDKKTDIAAVVTNESRTKYQLVIIMAADEKDPSMLTWTEDIMEDAAISVMPRSTIEGFEGEKTKKVSMKGDGINVEYFEKASFVLYWNGSGFKRIQTGD